MITKKLADEIVNVLRYNPDLKHEEKVLAVQLRLDNLVQDVEKACAEAQQRHEENKVVIDNRPQDIPQLAAIIISDQQRRGGVMN